MSWHSNAAKFLLRGYHMHQRVSAGVLLSTEFTEKVLLAGTDYVIQACA